jgi:membrane protease YdiL (CAAX protease family)
MVVQHVVFLQLIKSTNLWGSNFIYTALKNMNHNEKTTLIYKAILIITFIYGILSRDYFISLFSFFSLINKKIDLGGSRNDFYVPALMVISYFILFKLHVIIFYSAHILNTNQVHFNMLFRIVIIAPFVEEIFHRGVLFRYFLQKSEKFLIAGFFSSLTFTLFHFSYAPINLIQVFILGFVYSYVYKEYGLSKSILAHSFFNLLTVLFG